MNLNQYTVMGQHNNPEGTSFLHPDLSNYEAYARKSDFLDLYQSDISSVEIHSTIFYTIQKVEFFLITLISSIPLYVSKNTNQSIITIFNHILSLFYLSPSSFSSSESDSCLAIIVILLLILIMAAFTLIIGYKVRDDKPITQKITIAWLVIAFIFLPIPGYIMGHYFSYFFYNLTHTIYFVELMLISFTAVLWGWLIVTCNTIYFSHPHKKKTNVCQVNHNYISFQSFTTIFPLVQTILPGFLRVFAKPLCATIYFILTSLVSISAIVYISLKKPYNHDSMNKYVIFLFVVRIPLSLVWKIESDFPNRFEIYSLFLLIFVIVSYYVILKFFASPPPTKPNSINEIAETSEESSQAAAPAKFFDPFENWPYPFNLISATKQDIFLAFFLLASIFLMVTMNVIAAKRIPLLSPLPDFVTEKFSISKTIRETAIKPLYQISNLVIIFEIVLMFVIEFTVQEFFDVRRTIFIISILYSIRSVSFILTGLPAPCGGEPNCPCADPKNVKMLQEDDPLSIIFYWIFGVGMFLKYPQCGDLIISGHTIAIWLFTRTCCAALKYAVQRPFNWLCTCVLYLAAFVSLFYIVLSKNHYTIDVWIALIITELIWLLYVHLQKVAALPPRVNDSIYVRVIRWIETRPPKRALVLTNRLMAHLVA